MAAFSAPPVTENPFRSPAGLFLLGGGALGAWQASVLDVLETHCGPAFGFVLGFSAGALNGAGYFLGRVREVLESWRTLDKMMRLSPRLTPFSLFSNEPLRKLIAQIQEGEPAQARGRCRFTIASVSPAERRPLYARFSPRGQDGWDGSLSEHLLATCAIPLIWPPVRADYRGARPLLIDGGIPTPEPLSLDALGPCEDVLILSMVRGEEAGRRSWNPAAAIDQAARRLLLRQQEQAVFSLGQRSPRPRIYLLTPSRVLDSRILDFSAAPIAGAIALGAADADVFLRRPRDFLLS
jgi:predicted acylesterase/phospholipase RssA